MTASLSIGYELADLERALEAVSLLVEQLRDRHLSDAEETMVPGAVASALSVLVARIRHVRRAVCGAVDPATARTRHNAVAKRLPSDDPDVLLAPWTTAEVAIQARRAERTGRGKTPASRRRR